MTQPEPRSIPADGSVKVLWVPEIADLLAPTVAELTASEVIDLSCYLADDGWQPSTDEQVSTDDRLCSRQTYERVGRHTEQLDIVYVYQGQDLSAADNKAFATLRYREHGYIVSRWGADYEIPIASGDLVDIIPAECGRQRKQAPEANGRLRIQQKIFIRGTLHQDVAVVGGS